MRVLVLFVALLGLVVLCPVVTDAAPEGATPEKGSVEMAYRTYRKWRFRMPVVGFQPVSGKFDFSAGGGGDFPATLEGQDLQVDLDGDGAHDVVVEGESGIVTFERKDGEGNTTFKYAAKLVGGGGGWMYAPAGVMLGKLGGTKVQLIDMDGNGAYSNVGTDAIVVGRSKVASFLPEVANIGGVLYTIKPSADGRRLDFERYAGPAGTLDLKSALDTNGKLMELVVATKDRRLSYDLTAVSGDGMQVPAGEYVIHKATLGLGAARATAIHGRAKAIEVADGKKTTFAWGGPINAEFGAAIRDGQLGLDPQNLKYFGSAGEHYISFSPQGKSPEFTITDARDRKEIAKAIFTGC